jgi:hypothetical protein
VFFQPPCQLWTAQLNQEIHQAGITGLVQVKQSVVHRFTVGARCFKDSAGAAEFLAQPFRIQHLTGIAHQFEILSDALTGDKEPAADAGFTFNRAETAAEREIEIFPRLISPSEFDPGISVRSG